MTRAPSNPVVFAAAALGVGTPILALSTVITPRAPSILPALYLGLALPALVLSQAVVIATGVVADGRREVLGFDVGDSEDGAF